MPGPMKSLWWLSFADNDGCRGVCVVELDVELPDTDDEFILAVRRAHQYKINPGGQCRGTKIPEDLWDKFEGHHNKFYTKAEAAELFEAHTDAENKARSAAEDAAKSVDSGDGERTG